MGMSKQRFQVDFSGGNSIGIVDNRNDTDVYIKINGNFKSNECKDRYIASICTILNNNIVQVMMEECI